jgi:hypothetical protein
LVNADLSVNRRPDSIDELLTGILASNPLGIVDIKRD